MRVVNLINLEDQQLHEPPQFFMMLYGKQNWEFGAPIGRRATCCLSVGAGIPAFLLP